ncbi:FixH family protein [Aureibacillus halotolerans]|uniref:YtkA-like domain-containing protein n=1 Tax=Aureibacillus halotolerans TaxID=1508390 RepID=A0A4R6U7Z3_9BACI|nr:FixH family protein [Aureibacillus halotolerans]TDQ42670.1 hypothetical protein EV213_10199 [Aureibacillus halotolerans]
MSKMIGSNIIMGVMLLFIITGCSLSPGVETLYTQQPPLDTELSIVGDVQPDQEATVEVMVTNGDEPIQDAKVVFSVWKENDRENAIYMDGEPATNGMYTALLPVGTDGIYYVKAEATVSEKQTLTPIKRFVVGDLSEEEQDTIENDEQENHGGGGHHH